jgi:hypothetical protein
MTCTTARAGNYSKPRAHHNVLPTLRHSKTSRHPIPSKPNLVISPKEGGASLGAFIAAFFFFFGICIYNVQRVCTCEKTHAGCGYRLVGWSTIYIMGMHGDVGVLVGICDGCMTTGLRCGLTGLHPTLVQRTTTGGPQVEGRAQSGLAVISPQHAQSKNRQLDMHSHPVPMDCARLCTVRTYILVPRYKCRFHK